MSIDNKSKVVLRWCTAPFRIVWRLIVRVWRFIVLLTILYVIYEIGRYMLFSHSFSRDGNSQLVSKPLTPLAATMPGGFWVLNGEKGGPSSKTTQHMVFFISSKAQPTFADAGHGWVVWCKASVVEDSSDFIVEEFDPVGFGPVDMTTKWPRWVQEFYARQIGARLPSAIEPSVSKLAGVSYLSLKTYEESAVKIPQARRISPTEMAGPEFKTAFGNNPQTMLVVLISPEDYNESRKLISQFQKTGRYTILFRDCTTFVERVANRVGMYVPPRIIYPLPSDLIEALVQTNRKL